ncbi:glycogen/starch synthase [Candidatus Woesearchaeota archaeon]|nr:glycogen/starch synthase [Candidatus Woesearchaeota archaeon]
MAKKAQADCLFEVSWEVCNKVGGIYTVIKTKSRQTQRSYKEYFLVGPYFPKQAALEFEEIVPQAGMIPVFENLKKEGILTYLGESHGIKTILIDSTKFFQQKKNDVKRELWELYKIDSLQSPFDFDEPLVWSYAAGKVLEQLIKAMKKKAVVQAHEWLSASAILYLKSKNAKAATVFTTHATVLGRSLTETNFPLYEKLNEISVDEESYRRNIHYKHQLERAGAKEADIFTTVSEITAIEAEKILGRKAEVILPNGLDLANYPTFEESSIKHNITKAELLEFLSSYFLPYYHFNIDSSVLYFISGRYEFRNKGVDVLIKALGQLNERLKQEKSDKTIITLFLIPADVKGIKIQLLENKTTYNDIENFVDGNLQKIKHALISEIISKKIPFDNKVFDDTFIAEAKKKSFMYTKEGSPALVTHDLSNEQDDITLRSFREHGLLNRKEDNVKVLFYPAYLTGTSGLLDMDYYEVVSACHLGIFPSYYEPWGYTPLETAAIGVPAVTTDLSGFGQSFQKKVCSGICILPRKDKDDNEFCAALSGYLYNCAFLSKQERVKMKIEAKRMSSTYDWEYLIDNYIEAHNQAFAKKFS